MYILVNNTLLLKKFGGNFKKSVHTSGYGKNAIREKVNIFFFILTRLGAIHIWRQHPWGGGGVSEMLTKPDMGGRGGLTNDDVSKEGYFAAIA